MGDCSELGKRKTTSSKQVDIDPVELYGMVNEIHENVGLLPEMAETITGMNDRLRTMQGVLGYINDRMRLLNKSE